MSAERVDLAELRRLAENEQDYEGVCTVERKTLSKLLDVVEAALAMRGCTCGDPQCVAMQVALAPFKETSDD